MSLRDLIFWFSSHKGVGGPHTLDDRRKPAGGFMGSLPSGRVIDSRLRPVGKMAPA